jgi:hypothetical protein
MLVSRSPYRPLCCWCNDAGCLACEGTRAQVLEYRRKMGEAEAVIRELCFEQGHGISVLRVPKDLEELTEFVVKVLDVGRGLERRVMASATSTTGDSGDDRGMGARFLNLELRGQTEVQDGES